MRLLSILALLSLTAAANDWPRFLGPTRDGVSTETNLLRAFPDDGPPVVWEKELEVGFGGCAVVGDEVYVVDRVRDESDLLLCLDAATGKEKWRFEHEAEGEPPFPGSRSVPTVEDDAVYFINAFGSVFRIDRESHKATWSVKLDERYDGATPKWGWAQPALVEGDVLIVPPFGEKIGIVGLDKKTGEEIWKSGPIGDSHSSPTVMEFGGEKHVVIVSVTDKDGKEGLVTSYRPTDGEILWQTDLYFNRIPIPVVTKVDDKRIFATGGYDCGSMMLGIEKTDKGYELSKLWSAKKGSQVHPTILADDHLYFLANENSNYKVKSKRATGGLTCWTLDGKELWNTGNEPFMGRGGMIHADGMLIIQDGENGVLRLVDPSPEGFRLLAEANVFGSDLNKRFDLKYWTPPALSNGRLYLRGQEKLICVDLRAK
ncbi:PQQ-binding-like beta-propeller repeat protein [Haloferula rosea]|uniref:PQQ-binding-like beta-propeller repeat protein n=1 Tax=Haloferula rosea TaxID=490093 RepID=A0A934VH56_9BACT|nr:PQQ-binding-like beta-propeller repeat protein [Haloferula rosea]MBK1828722.1 PQQ-binding-like beta-propeller repeat protein [Haloferula rosea]